VRPACLPLRPPHPTLDRGFHGFHGWGKAELPRKSSGFVQLGGDLYTFTRLVHPQLDRFRRFGDVKSLSQTRDGSGKFGRMNSVLEIEQALLHPFRHARHVACLEEMNSPRKSPSATKSKICRQPRSFFAPFRGDYSLCIHPRDPRNPSSISGDSLPSGCNARICQHLVRTAKVRAQGGQIVVLPPV
jgi:hypothetical protein